MDSDRVSSGSNPLPFVRNIPPIDDSTIRGAGGGIRCLEAYMILRGGACIKRFSGLNAFVGSLYILNPKPLNSKP